MTRQEKIDTLYQEYSELCSESGMCCPQCPYGDVEGLGSCLIAFVLDKLDAGINSRETLQRWSELKDNIEERAWNVLADYHQYKGWGVDSCMWVEDVSIDVDEVLISYFSLGDTHMERVPLDYFMTLDRRFLEN